jgi:hypothetical protein
MSIENRRPRIVVVLVAVCACACLARGTVEASPPVTSTCDQAHLPSPVESDTAAFRALSDHSKIIRNAVIAWSKTHPQYLADSVRGTIVSTELVNNRTVNGVSLATATGIIVSYDLDSLLANFRP